MGLRGWLYGLSQGVGANGRRNAEPAEGIAVMDLPRGGGGSRPRLLRRIEDAVGLVVVWGPSGSGKSVLVRNWAERLAESALVWIGPPRSEVDPAEYWTALVDLIAGLNAAPAAVVLDLPDQLQDPQAWHQLLRLAAQRPGVKVVAIVRDASMFWEHVYVARGVEFVTPRDLRLDAREIHEWFGAAGHPLGMHACSNLAEAASGHAALVDGALRADRMFDIDFEGGPDKVEDALEQLARQYVEQGLLGQEGVGALASTAAILGCAREVTEDAAFMLGGADAVTALPMLERAGLLVRRPDGDGYVREFVPAVRRRLAQFARSQGNVAGTIGAIARHAVQSGDYTSALWYATEAEDWPLVVTILDSHWPEIIAEDLKVAGQALRRMPPASAAERPAIHAARSLLKVFHARHWWRTREMADALELIEPIERIDGGHSQAESLLAGTMRSVVLRLFGDFEGAATLAQRLDTLAGEQEHSTSAHAVGVDPHLPLLRLHWGLASFLHGDHVRAAELFQRAYHDSGTGYHGLLARNAESLLALHYAVLGEPNMARRWLQAETTASGALGWLGPAARVPDLTARALTALDRTDLEEASVHLAEIGEPSDTLESWAFVVYARCLMDLDRGDPEVGLDRLRRMHIIFDGWAGPHSLAEPLLCSTAVDLATAAGRPADARERTRLDTLSLHPLVRAARARAALQAGAPHDALADCAELERAHGGYTRVRLSSLVVTALALHEIGDLARAATAWNRAVALSQSTGLLRPFNLATSEVLDQLIPHGARGLAAGPIDGNLDGELQAALQPPPVELTERERAVLSRLDGIETVGAIAAALFVSPNTVKTQLQSLYRKLGTHSRRETVAEAHRIGLI